MAGGRPIVPVAWAVVIDAAGDLRAQPVDRNAVESLIDLLADHKAAVSHLPRRYTTRLRVYAHDVQEAVAEGIKVWKQASEHAGLPDWPVVHVEVTQVEKSR